MRGSIEAQGFTAEFESLPDGSYRLELTNSAGHLLASATFAPTAPLCLPDDADAWETAPAA
jgi:hypothetical protein